MAAYVKGAAFLTNLSYVIGQETFDKGMLRYFDTWKFKHPNVNDFIRVMEKESGLELDWFKEYMVNSTHTIDYSIKSVEKFDKKQTKISLERKGKFPMPIDVKVTYKKGKTETFTIPLRMMRGEKKMENGTKLSVLEDWPWTHPTYDLILNQKNKKVEKIEIDPSKRMGDANLEDNSWKK